MNRQTPSSTVLTMDTFREGSDLRAKAGSSFSVSLAKEGVISFWFSGAYFRRKTSRNTQKHAALQDGKNTAAKRFLVLFWPM